MTKLAERITMNVLEVLKKGGDNLAIYEAVRAALAATPAVGGEVLSFGYTNWHGLTSYRRVRPISIRYGTSEYHKHAGWLMLALDLDKNEQREFAMRDMIHVEPANEIPLVAPSASPLRGRMLDQANYKMGGWLSEALEDPNVCDAMKADINAWFEAHQPGLVMSASSASPSEQPAALAKRPVAFRVLTGGLTEVVLFDDEGVASRYAKSLGLEYQGLYVCDGSKQPVAAPWIDAEEGDMS